jgi:hypothetical protein
MIFLFFTQLPKSAMYPPCVHPIEIRRLIPQDKMCCGEKLIIHLHLVTRSTIACCLIKHCLDCTLHINMKSIIEDAGAVMLSQSVTGHRTSLPRLLHDSREIRSSGSHIEQAATLLVPVRKVCGLNLAPDARRIPEPPRILAATSP